MAMLCHMPNLADLIAPERDSVSDSCHEAAPREPWGYEGYMFGGGLLSEASSCSSATVSHLYLQVYRGCGGISTVKCIRLP